MSMLGLIKPYSCIEENNLKAEFNDIIYHVYNINHYCSKDHKEIKYKVNEKNGFYKCAI